jgi:hypothetical protein
MVQQFQYSRPKGIVDSEPPSEDDASDTSEKIMHHKKVAFSMPRPSPTATRMHHHEPREPVKRVRRPLSLLGSFKRIVCCHWCTDDRVTPYSETADDDMVTEAEAARLLGRRAKQLEMITYFVFAVMCARLQGCLPTTRYAPFFTWHARANDPGSDGRPIVQLRCSRIGQPSDDV